MTEGPWMLLSIPLRMESDAVRSRLRVRGLATLLGFSAPDCTRLAAATFEVARHARLHHGDGRIDLLLEDAVPQRFWIEVTAEGRSTASPSPPTPGQPDSGLASIETARRLLDVVSIAQDEEHLRVRLGQERPARAPPLERGAIQREIQRHLESIPAGDMADELSRQDRELLEALESLRRKSEELSQANLELEDTNRGVVALHAELDARAKLLSQSSELKSRMVSLVSHEFRTPLGSIRMLGELLLTDDATPLAPNHREQVELIQRTATELAGLVDDLLDLSKAQAGKMEVQPDLFQLDELFGSLRVLLRPLAMGRSVDLHFEIDEGLSPMYSDASKISLILRNLISNALKFTRQGEVRVRARALGPERVVFQVSDTGVGIALADQPRLFRDYSQIENPLQSGVKGTGLGLALVARIAALLGGTVGVESELGRGSTFSVQLPRRWDPSRQIPSGDARADGSERGWPLVPAGSPVAAPPRPPPGADDRTSPPPPHRPGPRRVLVVDDHPAARRLLVHHLERLGYETLEARDGAEGLWLARKEAPDLILLDLEMPTLSGWEVVPQLRSEPGTRGIPVVIVTGRSKREVEQAGLEVQGIVQKQDDSQGLVRSLTEQLDRLMPAQEEEVPRG